MTQKDKRLYAIGKYEQYTQLKRHKAILRGMHSQDDMPFSLVYDGYTVSDARRQINARLKHIETLLSAQE